jgi:tetratricopeptide (TPR) repeat protein
LPRVTTKVHNGCKGAESRLIVNIKVRLDVQKIITASSLCHRLLIVVVVFGGVVGFPSGATAGAGACPEWAARVVSIEGRVEALPAGETLWRAVALNDTFCPEDQIRTLEKSRAAVQLRNETMLRLDENTTIKFSAVKPESPSLLELFTGRALFMTRFPHPLTIDTPYVNASSGGTEYVIEVDKEHQTSTLTVIEGTMHLKNAQGSLTVTDGQSSVTHAGEKPDIRLVVNAKDVLHWALYYPPVLNLRDLQLGGTEALPATDWRAMVAKSIAAYQAGDVEQAFAALANAPANIDDPRFYAYRASLLLAVGRVEEAQADIEHSLTISPRNGLALALQSVIAVVQNRSDKALSLAQDAAAADPQSTSVRIALSYAWQANFNLPQALTAAQDATRLDPKAALAWARTAELWLSQGYLTEALNAAKQAEALNPREARVQTLLGFAYLTQIRVTDARQVFEKAIPLNSSDPMPRLGLGLAKIRQGNLAGGRQEIEIAAALDPGNALIRSYLGKAYYEEKRNGKAAIQFKLAEQLDPKDPTPYSYDAVLKQTTNRPVEALHDEETAIVLNDSRAVYRSRLLLDEDLSSRSVSQGRIAEDLGFGQLALAEGWKSVNADPANYSAHRFLADSYAALPNSEIARKSALLLSQLLQPLNTNPVQPSLSDRSAVSPGMSPADPSFNEYTRLFDEDGTRFLASGIAGNENTLGDEVITSGLYNRYSFSLGQFRYRTDGFRQNADLDQKIYDAFVQASVNPKLSVQGEMQLNDKNNGDLGLYFDPGLANPTLDDDRDIRSYRLGMHYAVTPSSDFILSGVYEKDILNSTNITPDVGLISNDKSRARTGEGQYLFHGSQLSLIAGAGYYSAPDTSGHSIIAFNPAFGPSFDIPPSETQTHHGNYYLYVLVPHPQHVTVTLGASVDHYWGGNPRLERNRFNPKLGLMWEVTPSTTLRVAGFSTVKRNFASDQTIEPTQVAGFQQFFEDTNDGTISKHFGIGIDQKFSSKVYGGLEYTKRDLKIPYPNYNANGTAFYLDQPSTIKRGRAYLYWAASPSVAVSAEYFYDKASDLSPYTQHATTHRVPLGISYTHPRGFFVKLKGTYIDQRGMFTNAATGNFEPGKSQFSIWDASLGYRLPRRLGLFSIGVANLFDRNFRYDDIDNPLAIPDQAPTIQPERSFFARLTLAIN